MKYYALIAALLLTACGQMKGEKGDPGLNGLDGQPGIQGTTGATGSTGPTGGMCVVTIPPGHHTITIDGSCQYVTTK